MANRSHVELRRCAAAAELCRMVLREVSKLGEEYGFLMVILHPEGETHGLHTSGNIDPAELPSLVDEVLTMLGEGKGRRVDGPTN